MKENLAALRAQLRRAASPIKAKGLQRFFKTGPGEYGAGDKFLGVMVPDQRKIVGQFKNLSWADLDRLVQSPWHEERLTALLILVAQFHRADEVARKKIYDFYLAHTKFINNWDLVDLTAPNIVGEYLFDKNRDILLKLARSQSLWERRIAILATFYFIKNHESAWALRLARMLISDEQDLIHKAVGWMLREVGKRCSVKTEEDFLKKYYRRMPRVMLRYAIEKFPKERQLQYLIGQVW